MLCEKTKDISVVQISCGDSKRYLPPTANAIEAMKKSLQAHGQINPIGVHPITRNTYRVISGATRFRAASDMGWKTIRASIWSGSDVDFQIHELSENTDRRDLKATQRREMRTKIKELQKKRLADVEPGKGGRGKKGGLRDAARQMGIDEHTARNRKETKVRNKDENSAVSAAASTAAAPTAAPVAVPTPTPAAPTPSSAFATKKFTLDVPFGVYQRFSAACEQDHISAAEGGRRGIREWTERREAAQKKNEAA